MRQASAILNDLWESLDMLQREAVLRIGDYTLKDDVSAALDTLPRALYSRRNSGLTTLGSELKAFARAEDLIVRFGPAMDPAWSTQRWSEVA
jgi:hypothetical protein